MRITLFVPTFPKLSETFIVGKVIGLSDRGHDVNIVCLESNRADWHAFPELAKRPHLKRTVIALHPSRRLPADTANIVVGLGRLLLKTDLVLPVRYLKDKVNGNTELALSSLLVEAALASTTPEVIHFEFGGIAPPYLGASQLSGAALVVSFRGYDINYVGLDNPEHYSEVWRKATAIHTLGTDLWNRAVQRGCPAEMPRALIPPAIDTDFFRRTSEYDASSRGHVSRPLRLLSVGRLEWKKGYEYAFAAVRLLLDRGVSLHYRIIGAGEYFEPLTFCRRQLGLENHVTFVGAADRDAVRSELEHSHILVHPAVSEGFCNAVVEAQSMQVPVVCTDADGLRENIAHQDTGVVVRRRDSVAMADALEELVSDGSRRRAMGSAGRQRAVSLYRIERQIDAFEQFYRSVIAETNAGRHRPAH